MAANKHITKIIIAVMAAAVVLCFLAIAFSGQLTEWLGGTGVSMEYESKLFNTDEIISIDIQMDEDEWNEMLSNAMTEEYYVCNVVINGKRINNVAIRPKGNTSLSAIAMDQNSDRFSLKLEFDHFVDGQTCYGLDKLILNNNYADATNMKEAVVYDMFQYLGADASLYNYAEISVNGTYWGVYLALEGVEESFMLRNFGTQDGELYKPDNMEMGGGNSAPDSSKENAGTPDVSGMDFSGMDLSDFAGMSPPSGAGGFPFGSSSGDDTGSTETETPSSGGSSGGSFSFDPGNMPGSEGFSFDPENLPEDFNSENRPDMGGFDISGKGGSSKSGGGANLNYTDDDLESYTSIWEGEVTNTGKNDHRKVVTALKNISEGTDLETYLDVDNILKYMAVHTFAVNMDSLSGSMAHNYYLYEYNGQLNIFPWDYNLSFGGMFSSNDATSMVNDAIDTPFSGTQFFDALLENEVYLAKYHAYLQELVDAYVNGGRFDEVYSRIRSQIDALVKEDPNASYTYEEYETATGILYDVIKLRAQSIAGQLDGTIPSTDAGQKQDSSSLIDASYIDVTAMGQFDMGGGGGGFVGFGRGNKRPESATETADGDKDKDNTAAESDTQPAQDSSQTPDNFDLNDLPEGFGGGNMPDMGSFDPNNLPEGFGGGNMPDMGGFTPPGQGNAGQAESSTQEQGSDGQPESSTADANNGGKTGNESAAAPSTDTGKSASSFSYPPGQSANKQGMNNLFLYGICLALAIAALLAVKLFARKKQK